MISRQSGPALVRVKGGNAYVADVNIADGLVHARHCRLKFGYNPTFLRDVPDRAWPPNQIVELRWQHPLAIDAGEVAF